MTTTTAEPRANIGISLFTTNSTENQALIMFDLTNPLIAEMVEDILDVADALEAKSKDTGVRIPLEQVKADFYQKHNQD